MSSDHWAPTVLDWCAVVAGDLILSSDDRPLYVETVTIDTATGAGQVRLAGHPTPYPVRADATVRVLVPVAERDALALTLDQLGGRIIERRTSEGRAA